MPDLPWYELAPANAPLDQGDLILECPVVGWREETPFTLDGDLVETLRGLTECYPVDVVVMTQACDLAERKVRNVVLCEHYSLELYREQWQARLVSMGQNPTSKAWGKYLESIMKGQIWDWAMINGASMDDVQLGPRLVSFHNVLSLPRVFVESYLAARGKQRLRLQPPYREHLSQAFARFFMRVGLPEPIEKTW